MKYLVYFCVLLCLGVASMGARADDQFKWNWYEVDQDHQVKVNLFVFYRDGCPHCEDGIKFAEQLGKCHPWLQVHKYETSHHSGNLELYRRMASSLKRQAGSVPAFFYCRQMTLGFGSESTTGQRIESALIKCHDVLQKQIPTASSASPTWGIHLAAFSPDPVPAPQDQVEEEPAAELVLELPELDSAENEVVELPWNSEVDVDSLSLPLFTLILAGCDAFNPCAFFVLLSLLSLLIHARSRARMFWVGGIFVLFSGLFYFLFMAAWLNVFVLAGHLTWITTGAGLVAIFVALINIKDYFAWKQGISLSIPESAKPGLFQRMRNLLGATEMWPMLLGTMALAAAANTYELLCTAGFPMVYTRVLTLRELPTASYYGYLAFYNMIYVIPLGIIVVVFTYTLGARKLQEHEGRFLKLLSGFMMLLLGVIILLAPELLHSLGTAVALMIGAVGLAVLVAWINSHFYKANLQRHESAVG
ncbi:hypothetical protein C5Y96_15210 [Blastopirellula marina]|uniref:Thioredoxin domain-containing protein n=1 Tax=Blastopirellula marina TaxID=124 RepID=A0A2S8FAD8_9BACT|nr:MULTISPECIES: hypothetical protein [Pirellulaceae]PQO29102.1 hypothetical protein C5Y96_15210 [Blastopirellula marina]RCS50293.1 hypothetical protein DTL36_15220 [Bremerella cremea]